MDFQVKVSGHIVDLEELEAALRGAGLGTFAAAIAWPRDGAQAHGLVAFVGAPPPADWRARLSARVPEWMLPSRLIALSDPPLTSHGKLDRRALERLLEGQQQEASQRARGTSRTAAKVAQIWDEILELDAVPLHQTFLVAALLLRILRAVCLR